MSILMSSLINDTFSIPPVLHPRQLLHLVDLEAGETEVFDEAQSLVIPLDYLCR